MNLRISVPAQAWIESTDETSDELLASVGGVSHDEVFSDYFVDDIDPIVMRLKVGGGKLHFHYNAKRKSLEAQVDYELQARLTSQEAKALINYTLGQLSDGIGNNFVQDYARKTGVFVGLQTERGAAKLEYLS